MTRDLGVPIVFSLGCSGDIPVATELFAVTSLPAFSCDLSGHGRFPDVELSLALACLQTSLHGGDPKGKRGGAACLRGPPNKGEGRDERDPGRRTEPGQGSLGQAVCSGKEGESTECIQRRGWVRAWKPLKSNLRKLNSIPKTVCDR